MNKTMTIARTTISVLSLAVSVIQIVDFGMSFYHRVHNYLRETPSYLLEVDVRPLKNCTHSLIARIRCEISLRAHVKLTLRFVCHLTETTGFVTVERGDCFDC